MRPSSDLIGKGSYGRVYKSRKRTAIKVLRTTSCNCVEIDILFRLKSPYLLRGIQVKLNRVGKLIIETELLTGSMRQLIEHHPPSSEVIKRLMIHFSLGIKHLHDQGYLHLDLSDANAMYVGHPDRPRGKIIDFGMAVISRDGHYFRSEERGTLLYRSIESIRDPSSYSCKNDIWALGILFVFMIGRSHPFVLKTNCKNWKLGLLEDIEKFSDPMWLRENIIRHLYTHLRDLTVIPLLTKMLELAPANRWTIDQVVDHLQEQKYTPLISNQVDTRYSVNTPDFKKLVHRLQTEFGDCSTEFMFTCFDLFCRVPSNLTMTCVDVVHQLYYQSEKKLPKVQWVEQCRLLQRVAGILRNNPLYTRAVNLQHLIQIYQHQLAFVEYDPSDDQTKLPKWQPIRIFFASL